MFGTFLKPMTLALFVAATMPMAGQAEQTAPNPTPSDLGETQHYRQFDCKNINSRDEWNACWNEPDQ